MNTSICYHMSAALIGDNCGDGGADGGGGDDEDKIQETLRIPYQSNSADSFKKVAVRNW